jgi:hypothetical protein
MTKLKVTKSSALARSSDSEPWRRPDWQSLWLASQSRPWRSMALVPAGPGASPELLVQVAVTLARTGMVHLGTPIHVADATRITLAQLASFSEELEHYAQQNAIILIALPALSENVTSFSLAQSADTSLLLVLLQQMEVAEAKKTVERVGAQRFIGSVVLRPGDVSIAKQG